MREYSETAKRKIGLYFASNYLYGLGKSHPQVFETLSQFEEDKELLLSVVDDAMIDKWREIFNESQRLTSLGKTYQEIFEIVKTKNADPEIVHFICTTWYSVQTAYVENAIESGSNISEGIQWVIIF